MRAVTVNAATYVKQDRTSVSITSGKTGWQKIGGDYYFYNSKGRLICGSFKYKGYYYYSIANGKRFTGWMKRSGNKYYYNRKNGAMFRNRWATGDKYTYYFNKSGVAIARQWLTQDGKKYYFLSNSTMAKGWQKIGKYYYYFSKKTGVMAKNTWIGKYYVNSKGQRVKSSDTKPTNTKPTVTQSGNTYEYKSSTLNIKLERKSVHGISYWVAHIKTSNAKQLKSALSNGTYGGSRQTTSDAVSSNGGIIGVNGSAFDYGTGKPSPLGMCIKNGIIYGDYMTSYSVMAVKKDGTIYTPAQGLMGKNLLAAGVKDTYNFGPVLIKDGEVIVNGNKDDVANRYTLENMRADKRDTDNDKADEYPTGLNARVPMLRINALSKQILTCDDTFQFEVEYQYDEPNSYYLAIAMHDIRRGGVTYDTGANVIKLNQHGHCKVKFEVPLTLFNNGEFKLVASLRTQNVENPKLTDMVAFTNDDNSCIFAVRDENNREYALLNDNALQIKRIR